MENSHASQYRKLGQRIQKFRKDQGHSQESFAKLLGKTSAHLSKIERGTKIPSLDLFLTIAGQLHVPPADLLEDLPHKESNALKNVRDRLNALLKVTPLEKAKLMLKVCQEIHSSSK